MAKISNSGNLYRGAAIGHPLFPDNSRAFQKHEISITVNDFIVINPSKILGADCAHWGKIPELKKFAIMGLRDYFNVVKPRIFFPEMMLEIPQVQRSLTPWQMMLLSASSVQEMEKLPYFWRGMSLVKRETYVPKKREVIFYNAKGDAKKITVEEGKKIQNDLHKLYGDIDEKMKLVKIEPRIFTGDCEVRLVSHSGNNKIAGELTKGKKNVFVYSEYEHTGLLNIPVNMMGVQVEKSFMDEISNPENLKDLTQFGYAVDKVTKKLGQDYTELLAQVFDGVNVTSVAHALEILKSWYQTPNRIDFKTAENIRVCIEEIDSMRRYAHISADKFMELSNYMLKNPRIVRAAKSDMFELISELKAKKATRVRMQELDQNGTYSVSVHLARLFDVAEKISALRLIR